MREGRDFADFCYSLFQQVVVAVDIQLLQLSQLAYGRHASEIVMV